MFSNRWRVLKILIPLLLIIILVVFAEIKGPIVYPGYKEANLSHQQFIGKSLNFGGRIEEINQDYFLVKIDKQPVKVYGKLGENKVNYLITGKALYQAEGSLKLSEYHISNLRPYKIILSIIPILAIGYLFLKNYA
ncbi:MAG: hypothetical protein Q8P63_00400 [Candidatus Nealsonbacteria bacterium]|nr:hypothetical protein [Candidatus Nealsonbacteria bacterium]